MKEKRKKSVGFCVNFLGRKTRKYLELEAEKLGLKTGDLFILHRLIKEEGLSQNQISCLMRMNKAHIARSTSHLISKNFIVSKSDKNDYRVKRLYLTDLGKELIPQIKVIFKNWSATLTSDFSKEEKTLILNLLLRMCDNAKQYYHGENNE